MMIRIKLIGKTKKGKEIVKRYGGVYRRLSRTNWVRFSTDSGPWLLLESLDRHDLRWVREVSDPDFIAELIEEN